MNVPNFIFTRDTTKRMVLFITNQRENYVRRMKLLSDHILIKKVFEIINDRINNFLIAIALRTLFIFNFMNTINDFFCSELYENI